jgi:uncharacterized protein (TIGR02453 family)
MTSEASFSPALFAFLRDLRANNDRDWFRANRSRYDQAVLEPALRFVVDFEPRLREISAHFVADPRPVGGSLFRIHRDTRFSRDKSPYKTQTGIQFRHELGRDVHAPGFYVHLAPDEVFVGAGIWHPDAATLAAIRSAIDEQPERWGEARAHLTLAGESLRRAPSGYDPRHPLIEDLRRKDFIAVCMLDERAATSPGFLETVAGLCAASGPLVSFLCDATGVRF